MISNHFIAIAAAFPLALLGVMPAHAAMLAPTQVCIEATAQVQPGDYTTKSTAIGTHLAEQLSGSWACDSMTTPTPAGKPWTDNSKVFAAGEKPLIYSVTVYSCHDTPGFRGNIATTNSPLSLTAKVVCPVQAPVYPIFNPDRPVLSVR